MHPDDGSRSSKERLRRLLEVGGELAGALDLDRVLALALSTARELTGAEGARFAVLDSRREELEGLLGHELDHSDPPRTADSLGLSVAVDEVTWGNLYLTQKRDGPFDAADRHTVGVLAGWLATAIKNAQIYHGIERQRDDLQRANRALEAATEIARAVGGQTELSPILETIVERGRLLVDADSLALLLADEDGRRLELAASSSELPKVSLSISDSTVGHVHRHRRPLRVENLDPRKLESSGSDGNPGAMIVPLLHRGDCLGVLVAIDSRHGRSLLPGRDEEPVLLSIAASAATAVGTARGVVESRVRDNLEAAERERARWARELHDDTLQNLAGLRMILSGARRRHAAGEDVDTALGDSLDQVDRMIDELRRLIADLRPAALDELGIGAALSALVNRVEAATGLKIELELDLGEAAPPTRLPSVIETAAYRLVQEALANVVAHAEASRVTIQLAVDGDEVGVRVADDGRGFDPGGFWRRSLRAGSAGAADGGFGLPGMRERVTLLRGWLDVDSAPGRGCTLTAILPLAQGR